MSKIVWLKRSEEWIKQNPGKGTMYKVDIDGSETKENLSAINCVNRKKYESKPKGLDDCGIYVIICEASKSAYIGQSINISTRLRSHKFAIHGTHGDKNKVYKRMKEDLISFGVESFQYLKHITGIKEHELTDKENQVMFEFMDKGYNLYNIAISSGNVYCPELIKPDIVKLISIVKQDDEALIKLRELITNL